MTTEVKLRGPLNAEKWNALLDSLLLLLGNRILSVTDLSRLRAWRHPWSTRVSWDGDAEQWQAVVRPGFVNGLDPTAAVIGDDDELVDRPLTDVPFIPLASGWRKVGEDAEPSISALTEDGSISLSYEPVPEIFRALGVKSKQTTTVNVDDPEELLSALSDATTATRRLRAMDLVLNHDRPGIGVDYLTNRPTIVSAPGARSRAYIAPTRRYTGSDPVDPLAQLAGDWRQNTRDSELICTVFMLSPEEAGSDDPVDESWTPFVKHNLFWNLCYAHNLPSFAGGNDLTLATNLAAGFGDDYIRQLLATNNQAAMQALDFLATQQVEGRFWSV